jgi:hypothetical protein
VVTSGSVSAPLTTVATPQLTCGCGPVDSPDATSSCCAIRHAPSAQHATVLPTGVPACDFTSHTRSAMWMRARAVGVVKSPTHAPSGP